MASTSVASAGGWSVDGPRRQPSAIASTSPDDSITCPVTSAESGDASQVTTGATQRGSNRLVTSSGRPRSSVSLVSAPGAMAFTVTP